MFLKKRSLKLFNGRMKTASVSMPSPTESRFFQELKLANTVYSISIYFESINYLQYFAILFDNNVIIAMYYLKTTITLKNAVKKIL